MAGGFDRTGFVGEDMAGGGADDSLVRTEGCGHGDEVGLGAAGQKPDLCRGAIHLAAQNLPCFGAMGIGAVAGGLLAVGAGQGFQYPFVAALAVIIDKKSHGNTSLRGHGASFGRAAKGWLNR